MDRIEPIRPSYGRASKDAVRPVAPISRRSRDQGQEQPKQPPKRPSDGEQHLLDEQA